MNYSNIPIPNKAGLSFSIGPLRLIRIPELIATGLLLISASVSPLMFTATAAGYGTMHFYAAYALLPASIMILFLLILAKINHWGGLYRGIALAALAGPLATIGLEIVRIIGFRIFHAMPGSMPMLMGVLITNRFMLGPDLWSNLVGWGDHIIGNGISFALVYILIFGRPRWWMGVVYAWIIATLFMLGPVMNMMGGIGYFGLAMGPKFPITVYLAHTVFGLVLGLIVSRFGSLAEPIWRRHLKIIRP